MSDPVIVASICARGGSKGVPRKNVRPLAGRPLIAHTIECARACPIFADIVVSTDDPEIAAVARAHRAAVPFLRPPELARDESPKWPVFRHLVERWEMLHGRRIDILVDLDTGVPLRSPDDVCATVGALIARDAEVVGTAYAADRNPYFNMVEITEAGWAQLSKPATVPIACRQAAPAVFSLSPAVYAIRRDALWNYTHWSQARLAIHEIPRDRAIDIDSELDFGLVEFLLERREAALRVALA
jgi:N-acylneuraminate cytidylyltransferase/CMP-N,N'-diacetyllegionaminic acid synthase